MANLLKSLAKNLKVMLDYRNGEKGLYTSPKFASLAWACQMAQPTLA